MTQPSPLNAERVDLEAYPSREQQAKVYALLEQTVCYLPGGLLGPGWIKLTEDDRRALRDQTRALCAVFADEIASLRAKVEELTGERDEACRDWREQFEWVHRRAMTAERSLAELNARVEAAKELLLTGSGLNQPVYPSEILAALNGATS